ncbi:uncharacterized protein UBRO_20459 [Ustilago bromivora]|uniref:CCHC-type domain-containing protein n=1 Tax=Ustilago bromivora TaxID=307758 RepID=A0A1K0FX58_9BASI|nr:uncharacterized protein UBRO_20459 [Ustilago bromivora]
MNAPHNLRLFSERLCTFSALLILFTTVLTLSPRQNILLMSASPHHADPLTSTTAGRTSTPRSSDAASTTTTTNATDPAAGLVEPDQEVIRPIHTGRLVWTSALNDKPTLPYEDLPFLSLLAASTSTERKISPMVPFVSKPVPICSEKESPTSTAKSTSPKGSAKVLGVPIANALMEMVSYIAQSLRAFVHVHDVWCAQISYEGDSNPLEDTNQLQILVSVPPGQDGGMDPIKQHTIPGWILIGNHKCENQYSGHLNWCNSCKSTTPYLHNFEDCPKRRCFICNQPGHNAANCDQEADNDGDAAMSDQQEAEDSYGANNLDYGQT